MAKQNSEGWLPAKSNRLASVAVAEEDDEAFLRPSAPAGPGRKRQAAPELVPNYDEAERFLRARRRVAPRKSWTRRLLASRLGKALLTLTACLALAALGAIAWAAGSFLRHDPHFRIDSSARIQALGNTELRRVDLLQVFGADIGRNVFFVPLGKREAELEALPWVKHATVMRLLPSTLRVSVVERVPIAFVRLGRKIGLVDAEGVLLPMDPATLAARHYSFPVVVGLDPAAPAEARAERMRLYQGFAAALGAPTMAQLSEVDIADLEDVRAVTPANGSDLLLHFGNGDYRERWESYQEHLPEWRQQYPNLSAIDLRYDRQVVLKMADAAQADEAREEAAAKPPAPKLTPKAAAHRPAAPAHPMPRATGKAATKPAKLTAGKTWYTERPGPRRSVRWVPHSLPGKGAPAR